MLPAVAVCQRWPLLPRSCQK